MPLFTAITYDSRTDEFHVTQEHANDPEHALRLHVGHWPHDDGDDPDEVDWLVKVATGEGRVEIVHLGQPGVWLWLGGADRGTYTTYLVKTLV